MHNLNLKIFQKLNSINNDNTNNKYEHLYNYSVQKQGYEVY